MAKSNKSRDPFAAIDWRVIDSPAFADLSHSAVRVLLVIVRQLTVNSTWPHGNNGHLQATFAWCSKFGIGSEHTLRDAIAELISHGFIYRTRSHGANKVYARYAVTWLSVTERKGIFLDGFVACAWRNWTQNEKKAHGKKCRKYPAKSAVSSPDFQQKMQEAGGQKVQTMN